MFFNKKFAIIALAGLSTALYADSTDKELSYALGVSISQQVKKTADIDNMDSFVEGFSDNLSSSELQLNENQLSYASGVTYAGYIEKQGLDIETESFLEGFESAIKDMPLTMTQDEVQQKIESHFAQLKEQKEEEMNMIAEQNKKEGEDYLAQNQKNADVVTLDSGLQYKIIEKSTAENHPKVDDTVVVHYTGRLVTGQEFDSSVRRNEPATFSVNQVIPGWVEVLQLMSPGDKWEVAIPSELAYQEFGPPSIGPNRTLIFDIELLDILREEVHG